MRPFEELRGAVRENIGGQAATSAAPDLRSAHPGPHTSITSRLGAKSDTQGRCGHLQEFAHLALQLGELRLEDLYRLSGLREDVARGQ